MLVYVAHLEFGDVIFCAVRNPKLPGLESGQHMWIQRLNMITMSECLHHRRSPTLLARTASNGQL